MPALGTRTRNGTQWGNPAQGRPNSVTTADPGLSKYVSESLTFSSANGSVTGGVLFVGGPGPFGAFIVGDPIVIVGTNLNDGFKTVVGIDNANFTYLILSGGAQNEGPIQTTIRTP
jgi:hypothetical protein